jgi:hypothetical protein
MYTELRDHDVFLGIKQAMMTVAHRLTITRHVLYGSHGGGGGDKFYLFGNVPTEVVYFSGNNYKFH